MKDIDNKTLLVLGATSGLAHEYLRLVAQHDAFDRYILIARDASKLTRVANDIAARSGKDVIQLATDFVSIGGIDNVLMEIQAASPSISECFLAYGTLGDQQMFQDNPQSLFNMLNVNYVSAVLWMERIANLFAQQGHGHLVVIGSVAGDRGRQSNYLYGSTKSGLERVCEGMAHRFASDKNIHVTLAKPGFIDTPMTDHLEKKGPLWAKPDTVAEHIYKAVQSKRVRVYTPFFWRFILLIVRALPIPVFHKTKM